MSTHTDLYIVDFLTATHYLREVQNSINTQTKLHHMKFKAAWRRCFEMPVCGAPTTCDNQASALFAMFDEMRFYKQGSLPQVFCVYSVMKFSLEILKNKRGMENSVIEKEGKLGTVLMDRTVRIQETAVDMLTGNDTDHDHPIYKEIFAQLVVICEEVRDLYSSVMLPEYQKTKCVESLQQFKEELMQKTCHPSRVQWWMDQEDYQEIFGTM